MVIHFLTVSVLILSQNLLQPEIQDGVLISNISLKSSIWICHDNPYDNLLFFVYMERLIQ